MPKPTKQTSPRVSSLAGKGLAGGKLTPAQQKSVYASALNQDEEGQSKPKPKPKRP
jgi:hypothetical protein